jgi:sugar phosphate permease
MKASLSSEPTHARRSVLGLVFALAVITYLDRLCISAAMPSMADEFSLSPDQKGWVFSAFTIAYSESSARCGVWRGAVGSAIFPKSNRRSTRPS